jgi:hypothetical protein
MMNRAFPGILLVTVLAAASVHAATFSFTTGSPDGRLAAGSRPGAGSIVQIEAADDFIVTSPALIKQATFTGLMPSGSMPSANVTQVRVKIYRVFPADSVNPPSGKVPTRTNSPADQSFSVRDTADNSLTFTTTVIGASFTALNSVLVGIHQSPNQTTGGEGAVTGEEVMVTVTFSPSFVLPAGHYFVVPQVELLSGNFYWLSTPTPPIFTGDLQSWIRNDLLAPDWLRIGTDIIGGATPPRFNQSFSLSGLTVEKADFNSDGTSDIALQNKTSGDVAVWLLNSAAITSGSVIASPGSSWTVVATGDFNGDGFGDLLLQNSATNAVAEWQMNGTAITGAGLVTTPAPAWKVVGAGDFNADGKSDVLLQNSTTGDIAEWQMNGGSIAAGQVIGNPGAGWKVVAVGDVNGDSTSDLILQNISTGDVAVWEMSGFTISLGAVVGGSGTSWKVISAADFNGDGRADIVLQNSSTGDVAVWLMNGTTITSGAALGNPGSSWKAIGAGDFNGDGLADILLQNSTTGDVAEWSLNATATAIVSGVVIGSPGANWSALSY